MIQLASRWVWLLPVGSGGQNVWGRFDHERPTFDLGLILLLLTAAVVVLAIWLVLPRWGSRFRANGPRALFHELCRAHGLGASSRRLLKRLAAARAMANPAELFVEPGHFEKEDLPPALQSEKLALERLRDQLFN
jgi:hypothetical protein